RAAQGATDATKCEVCAGRRTRLTINFRHYGGALWQLASRSAGAGRRGQPRAVNRDDGGTN
ncbi:MAG: hypothetical protein ACPIOQ_20175, partial [Promethearchaeia archaeon]